MIRIDALDWDEEAENHIARHRVRLDEVEEAINNILYARKSGKYLLVLARTEGGRHLTIILDDEGDGLWYVVTARPMTAQEKKLSQRKAVARR